MSHAPVRQSTTVGPAVLKDQSGYQGGALNVNPQSADYTAVLSDSNGLVLHPVDDDHARTFTIDSNANMPCPIGTVLTFINEKNTLSIAITDDTMTLAGGTSTGTRTLGAYGYARAIKTHATSWVIEGVNLT